MISEANQHAIEDAGLSFILGAKIPEVPYRVTQWRTAHPGEQIPGGHVFVPPWPATAQQKAQGRRDKVIYYQYKADRARRTLRGIDEQVAKAEKAVAGKTPVKRNRFIKLVGADKSINRELEAKARAIAGLKAYITNIDHPTPQFVIDAYHQLHRADPRRPADAHRRRTPPRRPTRRPRAHQLRCALRPKSGHTRSETRGGSRR